MTLSTVALDLASVAVRVMYERAASPSSPLWVAPSRHGADRSAAALVHLSAVSFPSTPTWEDPADDNLASTGVDAVADLNGGLRETLGRPQDVRPHPLDSTSGIGEDGEPASCSLKTLDLKLFLENSANLSIKGLLISAEVESAP